MKTDSFDIQVGVKHYEQEGLSPLRVESITQQLREIAKSKCHRILEIGVGAGLIKAFLGKFSEVEYTSIDIDERLSPDYVGSVLSMPFSLLSSVLSIVAPR
jgi:protein-L-isoaspartate O-methyltransferase